MFRKFIERPVLATVVSIMLVILGIVGLKGLPIQMFPDIAPPTVQVKAFYPGANAETILRSVAPPLEEAINGVEDMIYMSSTATNDGSLVISVFFKLGTNPDQAAVNVQNRVSSAMSLLPPEVVQAGITTKKEQNGLIMGVNVFSEDEKVFDKTFIANYAQINILPEIQRVPGVGEARIIGASKDYSMRVWLNPAQMAAYHLTPEDITTAIRSRNLEAAPGRFGESSPTAFEYVIKYKGKNSDPKDYENMIVRRNDDGSLLRLKDVAKVELGAYTYGTFNTLSGKDPDFTDKPAITIQVLQLPNSNAREIQVEVEKLMVKASHTFPPGLRQQIIWYSKDLLDQSIEQVVHTLVEAFILVFLVVFIFLQDFRSTLIPAIAVPVALIGTFFFMSAFGFSINLLTLFALLLAIGIVVDDAIVVVEAVHAKMEQKKMPARTATLAAMHEITPAIISITLVMAAVFLPVGFMKGSAGVFYRQFAFTLAIAIFISAVNALTLSPALAALFLKGVHDSNEQENRPTFKQRFFAGFNTGFDRLTRKYVRGLKWLILHKWVSFTGLALVIVITGILVSKTQTGFIPSEDQNFAAVAITLPPGSSQDRTQQIVKQVDEQLLSMENMKSFTLISGLNIFTGATSPSSAVAFYVPKKDRGKLKDLSDIMNEMRRRLSVIKGASVIVFTLPTVPGFGNVDGLDFVLQDRSGGKLDHFSSIATNFLTELNKRKEIALAYTAFRADYPQLEMVVDEEKAAQLRVDVKDLLVTMQTYYGSQQVSDFNRFGKYYRVMVQADPADRARPSSLEGVLVRNSLGEMIPISTLISLKEVSGPETVTRYNLYNSIPMNANPKDGYSTGDAIKAVEEVAAETLPPGYSYEFSGVTREEIISGGQSLVVFLLSVLFVYFLLSAQYNSYILPLAVLLSIPTGVLGVFSAIKLAGIENNIYVQVALIMLIGLLAKNAILIVEFAVQRRQAGKSLLSAALEAAKARLRPIIMTSIAFVAGMIPMMRATGPSAAGNHSISIGAAGGMASGVLLGIFIVPVLFVVFQYLQEKVSSTPSFKAAPQLATGLLLFFLTGFAIPKTTAQPLPWKQFLANKELADLIDTALVKNNDLQIALKDIEAADQLYKKAKQSLLPEAGISVTSSNSIPSKNSLNGLTADKFLNTKDLNNYMASVDISWEADIWGKTKNKKGEALASWLKTQEARKGIQSMLIAAIANGYYNLLMLDKQLVIAKKNLALTDSTLTILDLQYSSAQVTSLAVQQEEAQKLAAAQLIPRLEQQISIQENALNTLIGVSPQPIRRTVSLDDINKPAGLDTSLPAEMISLRPDVKSNELELTAATARIGLAKANMYPSLTISASGGVNSLRASDWFNLPASLFGIVAGGLTQPLLQKRELRTQYNIAVIRREQSVLRFRQSVLTAFQEVSDALISIDRLDQEQSIAATRVSRLQQATANATLLFTNGMASYLEVITAQSNVLSGELELASIKREQLNAVTDLYRSLGGGWK